MSTVNNESNTSVDQNSLPPEAEQKAETKAIDSIVQRFNQGQTQQLERNEKLAKTQEKTNGILEELGKRLYKTVAVGLQKTSGAMKNLLGMAGNEITGGISNVYKDIFSQMGPLGDKLYDAQVVIKDQVKLSMAATKEEKDKIKARNQLIRDEEAAKKAAEKSLEDLVEKTKKAEDDIAKSQAKGDNKYSEEKILKIRADAAAQKLKLENEIKDRDARVNNLHDIVAEADKQAKLEKNKTKKDKKIESLQSHDAYKELKLALDKAANSQKNEADETETDDQETLESEQTVELLKQIEKNTEDAAENSTAVKQTQHASTAEITTAIQYAGEENKESMSKLLDIEKSDKNLENKRANSLKETISDRFKGLRSAVVSGASNTASHFVGFAKGIGNLIGNISFIKNLISNIMMFARIIAIAIPNLPAILIAGIGLLIAGLLVAFWPKLKEMYENIVAWASDKIESIINYVSDLGTRIVDGIRELWGSFINKIPKWLGGGGGEDEEKSKKPEESALLKKYKKESDHIYNNIQKQTEETRRQDIESQKRYNEKIKNANDAVKTAEDAKDKSRAKHNTNQAPVIVDASSKASTTTNVAQITAGRHSGAPARRGEYK